MTVLNYLLGGCGRGVQESFLNSHEFYDTYRDVGLMDLVLVLRLLIMALS